MDDASRLEIDISAVAGAVDLADDGIWYGEQAESISYPVEGNSVCFEIEDQSFWFKHRNECIVAAVGRFPPKGPIVDVGGGNGYVTAGLDRAGFPSVLVEPGREGAKNARRRGLKNIICSSLESAGFRAESLPAVGFFDVVEHIENDVKFLRVARELMMADGRLYLTVPAYGCLWSHEDEIAGHFRRYRLGQIIARLKTAGFDVVFASYIFRPLPLAIGLGRVLPYRLGFGAREQLGRGSEGSHTGLSARVLGWLLKSEVERIAAAKPMRVGGSCLVVARPAGTEYKYEQ